VIITFAGGGTSPLDGVPAITAALSIPRGLAVTAAGDLPLVDTGAVKVRRVSTAGVISTVAGNGGANSGGDGGPATAAGLNNPISVAVDATGNIFIAESSGHRVRRVSVTGTISTFAGSGIAGSTGGGGTATLARLNEPYGVAVDPAGNVFVAEMAGQRIRKIAPDGMISTVAGTGVAGFSGDGALATAAQLRNPMSVTLDSAGDPVIADSDNYRLRRVLSDGTIVTIAGDGRNEGGWNCCLAGFSGDGGTATQAQLWSPRAIALDPSGNLYIADELNHRVRRVTPTGTITTVAGNGVAGFSGDGGPGTSARLNSPTGVAADSFGNVYIADDFNARVRRLSTNGQINTFAGTGQQGNGGDGGAATSALLFRPRSVAVNAAGEVFIADVGNQRVRRVSAAGTITTVFTGELSAVSVAASGNVLVMQGNFIHRIVEVSPIGGVTTVVGTGVAGFSGDGGQAASAQVYLPTAAIPDGVGNLYIADGGNNRIRVIAPSGVITTMAGQGGLGFEGDGGPAIQARFANPMSLARDSLGRLLVADLSNNRVRAIVPPSPPATLDDSHVVAAGALLSVSAPGVLSNDSSDGGQMTAAVVGTVAHGTLTLASDGGFSYQPAGGYAGTDMFTYRATNAVGPGNLAMVTINVMPTAPVSASDTYATVAGTELTVAAPGVLGNDASSGGAMSAAVVTSVGHGMLTLSGSGAFSYTAVSGFTGADSFTYRATNAAGTGHTATVTINVAAVGLQPPSVLRVTSVVGNIVTIRWATIAGSELPTNHVVEGGLAPGQVLASTPTGSAEPIFKFVAPTGSFFVRVHALAGVSRSSASNEVPLHVNLTVPPSAPTDLLGLVNGSSLALSWRHTFNGGVPQSALLEVTGGVSASIPIGPGESFGFAGVPPGTYTLAVRSVNAGGASASSPPVTLTFPAACTGGPLPATNFIAYKAGGILYLAWESSTTGPAPTGYVLNVTGSYVGSLPMGVSRELSGAAPPGTYSLTMVATNQCGVSSATPSRVVSIP